MFKILLVEDNKGDQVLFQEAIKEVGIDCDLSILDQADDIVHFVDKLHPRIIFMDIMMSGTSGVHAVKLLKHHSAKNIPIVFLTGIFELGGELNQEKGINIEGHNYPALKKPIETNALKGLLSKYL